MTTKWLQPICVLVIGVMLVGGCTQESATGLPAEPEVIAAASASDYRQRCIKGPGEPPDFDELIRACGAALQANPEDVELLDTMCFAQSIANQPHGAVSLCSRAIEAKRDPSKYVMTREFVFHLRGIAYLCLGNPVSAIDDFNSWIEEPTSIKFFSESESNLTNPLPYFYRGVAYRMLGKIRQSEFDFERANLHIENENFASLPMISEGMMSKDSILTTCIRKLLREMSSASRK